MPRHNVEDAPAKAYIDLLHIPRTEQEIASKLRLPLERVEKSLAGLRALKFVRQAKDGTWVRA